MPPTTTELDVLRANARLHEQAGNWYDALALYHQLLADDDDNADLHNDMALAYEKTGDLAVAERHYRRALALDPHFYATAYNLAQLIRAKGERDETIKAFADVYALASTDEERQEVMGYLEQAAGEPVAVCAECRCVSSWHQAFQRVAKRTLCPYCVEQEQIRLLPQQVKTVLFGGSAVAILLVFMAWHPLLLSLHYTLTRILIFWGAIISAMVVHEMAHTFVALITGGRVHIIMFGVGPVLASRQVGETCISIHRFLYLGITLFYYPPVSALRVRAFLAFLAGPLFNGLVALAALLFVFVFPLPQPLAMYWIPQLLIGANLFQIVLNCLPIKQYIILLGSIPLPTDILSLVYLIQKPEWVNRLLLLHHLTVYGNTASSFQPNYAHVLYAAEAGLALAPYESNLLATAGVAALELGQWERAHTYFAAGVGVTPENLLLRSMALNNLAYWHLL